MLSPANNRKAIFAAAVIFAFAVLSAGISAQAQASKQISIQGKLSDSGGKALDGAYQMKFDFLDAGTGALVKSVGPQTVSAKKGIFTALITPPSGLDFSAPYLVDVSVNGQKLSPSFTLSYSPYSLKAVSADTAASAGSVAAANIAGKILDAQVDSVSSRKISGTVNNSQVESVDAGKVSGVLNANNIPALDSGKIISGIFDSARIPSLDPSKISGIFSASQIPSLDAGKIASGIFDAARIPSIGDSKITDVAAGKVSGTFDASKIGSGIFSADRIPGSLDSKLSYRVSAGVSSVSDGATINFNSKSFGVSSFSQTPVVTCSSEDGWICAATSVTTSGFTAKLIFHNGARPASAVYVNWIAIGS